MRILLVEDEKQAALRLQTILKKIATEVEIVGICKSIQETIKWFKDFEQPDLLFLDIQLSDGISFDLFNSIEIECPIIFVTAFNNYAIKAFKVNSIDYILKPYSQNDIKKAIEKYKDLHKSQTYGIDKSVISELLKSLTPNYKSRFFTKINHTVYSISTNEILCFNFEDNATVLVRNDNRSFVINYSLNSLEQNLEPKQFFRINRKSIINIDSIKKMNVLSKSRIEIVLKNNKKKLISRSKTTDFKVWLDI